jgi:hypothetical protein
MTVLVGVEISSSTTGFSGPAAALPEVLTELSADCPRQQDWRIHDPCGELPGADRAGAGEAAGLGCR